MPPKKQHGAEAGEDPNKLVRGAGGTYRSADDRFEVRKGGAGWSVIDMAATDELGQPLLRGPYPTLDAVREALPEARRAALKSLGDG